jgi:hypothetical protein
MYVKFGLWDHDPIIKDGNLFDLFCVVEISQSWAPLNGICNVGEPSTSRVAQRWFWNVYTYDVLNEKGHTILLKYTWYIYNIWKQPKKLWGFELYHGTSVGTGSPDRHFSRWGSPGRERSNLTFQGLNIVTKKPHSEALAPCLMIAKKKTHFLLATEEGCFWVEFSFSFLFSCTNLVA